MHIVEHIVAAFQEASQGPVGPQPGAGAERARIREAARRAELKHYYRHTSESDAPSRQQKRRITIHTAKRTVSEAYKAAVRARRKPTADKSARPEPGRRPWREYRAEWVRIAAEARARCKISPSPSRPSPEATGERAARPSSPPSRGRAAQRSRVPA